MSDINEVVQAFATLCTDESPIDAGQASTDYQGSLEAAEVIQRWVETYIATLACLGATPTPPLPANLIGDTELYE